MYISEAKAIIKQLLLADPKKVPALMLWGAPGFGKTETLEQVVAELNWAMIDLRLAQRNPVDLLGLPTVDPDTHTAKWLHPDELPQEHRDGEHGVLFLDELPNADRTIQNAALPLIHERKIGSYTLPPSWRVVAAGNRVSDRAGSFQMTSSLANRFIHLPVCSAIPALEMNTDQIIVDERTVDDWKDWAYRHGIREEIISFLNFRNDLLWKPTGQIAYASPRSWAFASRLMDILGVGELAQKALEGCVGTGVTAELMAFIEVAAQIPDPEAILQGKTVQLPEKPDISFAVCGALVSRLNGLQNTEDPKALLEAVDHLFEFVPQLKPEFRCLLMADIGRSSNQLFATVVQHPGWSAFCRENGYIVKGITALEG